jgi:hypothetical protein
MSQIDASRTIEGSDGEKMITELTAGERAWIRRYAHAGMPMADIAEYASDKADANVSPAEVERFLSVLDNPTSEVSQESIEIVSGGFAEVLKRLTPSEKAWIRIGYNRGKSAATIAAGLTAKHRISVAAADVGDYLDTRPNVDEVLLPAEIHTIEDFAQRISRDVEADLSILNRCSEVETTDRYIKPFLKLLGWNFQDPSQVKQNRFRGNGVKGQSQFDIHLGYTVEARSIIVEAKQFSKKILDDRDHLRSSHKSQFEKYVKEKHRILVFTNGKELIAFDKELIGFDKNDPVPVLVIKATEWAQRFDDAKKLMSRSSC